MPSEVQVRPAADPRVEAVTTALDGPAQAFRSALAITTEEVRGLIESARPAPGPGEPSGSDQREIALGAFAQEYMQLDRFVAFQTEDDETDQVTERRLEAVLDTLDGAREDARSCTVVEVSHGQSLFAEVERALANIGRVFGAARVVNLTRSAAYSEAEHAVLLTGLEHRSWGPVERAVAPPLIITGEGRDLRAADLAGFLDGRQKIVLLVRGQVDPALLARLITPGTFVQQASEASELERFAAFDGPGIAALVAEPAARFVHDPAAGATPAERLTVDSLPRIEDIRPTGGALGGMTEAWLRDGARHLASLAAAAGGSAQSADGAPAAGGATNDEPEAPIDKLAAWLVNQTDLSDA